MQQHVRTSCRPWAQLLACHQGSQRYSLSLLGGVRCSANWKEGRQQLLYGSLAAVSKVTIAYHAVSEMYLSAGCEGHQAGSFSCHHPGRLQRHGSPQGAAQSSCRCQTHPGQTPPPPRQALPLTHTYRLTPVCH